MTTAQQTPLEMITSLEAQLAETTAALKVLQKEGNLIPGKAVDGRSLAMLSEKEVLELAKKVSLSTQSDLNWLDVPVDNEGSFHGYPIADWKQDINRRLKIIRYTARQSELTALIAELEPILPEEVKTARKMAQIQAKMANLTSVSK